MNRAALFASVLGGALVIATAAAAQFIFSTQAQAPYAGIVGVTGNIGGSLLTVGSCATGTATVTGATTSMVAVANPTTYQGDGIQYQAYVSAANTVTVKACALLALTPAATTYKVRVLQ